MLHSSGQIECVIGALVKAGEDGILYDDLFEAAHARNSELFPEENFVDPRIEVTKLINEALSDGSLECVQDESGANIGCKVTARGEAGYWFTHNMQVKPYLEGQVLQHDFQV